MPIVAGAPAEQRAVGAGAGVRSRASSTCRTSSPGCWWSRSSSRCSAAPGCSRRPCATARASAPSDIMTNPDTFIVLVTVAGGLEGRRLGHDRLPRRAGTIDPALYEAAAADGADRWRRLWHITLPGLRPVIVLLLILRLGDALTVGFEQFILQRDAVGAEAAEVLDTFVYYQGLLVGDFGLRRGRRPVQGSGRARADPGRQQVRPPGGRAGGVLEVMTSQNLTSSGRLTGAAGTPSRTSGRPGRRAHRRFRAGSARASCSALVVLGRAFPLYVVVVTSLSSPRRSPGPAGWSSSRAS